MATATKTFFVDGNEHYSSENMRMRRRNTFDTEEPKKQELTITSCKWDCGVITSEPSLGSSWNPCLKIEREIQAY